MEFEKNENHENAAQETSLKSPAVELFLNPARAAEVWPEEITTNESFLEQTAERKKLNECLNDVFDRLPRPDMSFESAISQGHITEEQIKNTYTSLSSLLESGQGYERIILYLPFEFLPNTEWHPATKELQQATDRFRSAYMKAWKNLLSAHDVRANFVDGDVLEKEQKSGNLPRVVKAAHLIPKLVENGFMDVKDVITLMEKSDDRVFKNSIADALPVLADMELLSGKEIGRMKKSKDRLVSSMARIIVSNEKSKSGQAKTETKTITLLSCQEELAKRFASIDEKKYGDITKNRLDWLKQKKKQEAIESLGDDISAAIIDNSLTNEATVNFLTPEAGVASQQALINGVRKAIEFASSADKANSIYAHHKESLLALWKNEAPEAKEELTKTFCRLRQLGIADDQQLAELNIVIPKLAGPFSENLKAIEPELQEIKNAIDSIELNPEI